MASPDLVLHDIVDPSEWPLPVKRIAQTLEQPLPTYLSTGPYPFVSSRASNLLNELPDSPFLRVTRDDNLTQDGKPLTCVFDIVLSTVSELRELVKYEDHSGPRPTIPLWSTLIKALGHACSDDISILGEVPFILPRAATFEQRQRETLDGTATVLLSYVVDNIEVSEPQCQIGPVDVRRKSINSHPSDDLMDGEDVSMYYSGQPSTQAPSMPSIDVPFDAHVLPGRGRWLCAILPLLCVADEANITPLMSSVLYQRYVWGIDDPVVGISFSKTGTIGRVLLGWLDLEYRDDYNLPTVNIAHSITDSVSNPSLGVFDLTDPAAAFFLAQFILGLDSHFHAIMTAASNLQMRTLDWRSDHIATEDGEQWKSRIEYWAREIMPDDSSEDSFLLQTPSPPVPPSILSVSPSPHPLPSMSGHGKKTNPPSAKSQGLKVLQQESRNIDAITPHPERPARSPHRGTTSSTNEVPSGVLEAKPGNESPLSSSSFGNRSAQGLTDPLSISTWLFDRRVLTIALVELKGQAEDVAEINDMISQYHAMTKFLWPDDWSTLSALPRVDSSLEDVRQHLFHQYKELCDKGNLQQPMEALDPTHTKIFNDRFSALLEATVGAFTLKAVAQGRPVYEAEARHDWDAVLYRFLVAPGEGISANVLLERTLRFPRNNSADSTDSHACFTSQQAIATAYYEQCASALSAAVYLDEPVREQTLAASAQASSFVSNLHSFKSQAANFLDKVKERAAREPRSGKCDSIFVTPVSLGEIPGTVDVEEYLNTFGLVPQPKFTPPKLQSVKDTAKSNVTPSASSSHLSPRDASALASPNLQTTLSPEMKKLLRNPLGVSCTESNSVPAFQTSERFVSFDHSTLLLLSGFVVEYKKWNDNAAKALNQERTYLVSVVTHLATLGIKGFAVFGLITAGQVGGIAMAWQSKVDDKIYIIERNIRTFNLSSPIQAFQFASFLIRLREHTDTLKELFDKDGFLRKAEKGELSKWTMDAQVADMSSEVVPVVVMEDTAKSV